MTTRTQLIPMRFIRISILTLFGSMILVSCSDDATPVETDNEDFSSYLSDFSQKVAVATYTDMKTSGAALNTAVQAFNADPSNQSKLDAAAQAWVQMRAPWEASEAFLFGPAANLSLDPSLDSWPVDRQQLDDVLSSNSELTPQFVAEGLVPALRGFHTVEYLLFRDGSARKVADVTAREREYLVATTQVLADDAATLADAWINGFANEFANAGNSGSRYVNQIDAVLEILDGMVGICDEVANGKIADPFDENDPRLVESQFSWNSITDFQNNLRSVQNTYTGGYHNGTDGKGLNEYVAAKDAELDQHVQEEIQDAIDAIAAIPHPFRNHLDATVEITAAQEAILHVMETLQDEVIPLFSN